MHGKFLILKFVIWATAIGGRGKLRLLKGTRDLFVSSPALTCGGGWCR